MIVSIDREKGKINFGIKASYFGAEDFGGKGDVEMMEGDCGMNEDDEEKGEGEGESEDEDEDDEDGLQMLEGADEDEEEDDDDDEDDEVTVSDLVLDPSWRRLTEADRGLQPYAKERASHETKEESCPGISS
jgi:rRNA biogenesis protein RRP5